MEPAPVATMIDGKAKAAKTQGMGAHFLHYSTANVLVILAGFISFPVLTRLLDNTQYGILGYYETWALMAVAVGKLGAQHAIQRFYPYGGDEARLRAFSTNLFYLPLAMSMVLWVVVGGGLAAVDLLAGLRQPAVFWLALVAVPMAVYSSLVETVLRVTERSRLVMASRIFSRWMQLAMMLGAVAWIQQSAVAAYGGKLLATALVIGFYVYWAQRNLKFSRASIDPASMRQGLTFGMPLVANEMFAVALILVDRTMLLGMTGDFAQVGIYSIGASLAMQVHVFTNLAIFESFTPMANRLFVTEGAEAVRALKAKVLSLMTHGSVGIAVMLWCFGTDAIIALSGPSKAASGPVFALMGVSRALMPLMLVAGYGLMLEKRSTKVMLLMCGSMLVNTALNWLWIPTFGVMGAVYATIASSATLAAGHCLWVPRSLLKLPDLRTVASAGVGAAACLGLVGTGVLSELRPGWERLLVGGVALGVAYAALVLALDPRLRTTLLAWRKSGSGKNVVAAP